MSSTTTPDSTMSEITANINQMQSALENVGTNIFIADTDLNLVYMNAKARETLETIEDVIFDTFGYRPDEIMGMCLDSFTKDPSYQRQILRNPKNLPHKAEIPLGPLTFDLQVAAIYDINGEFVGTIVNWEDITAKKASQSEADKSQQMLKQSPVNILLCDPDLNIVYANDNSITTLKQFESAGKLDFRVDDVIGMCIDDFYQDPSKLRNIIENHKAQLPCKTEIMIGGENIDLQADAIYNQAGEFLGAMATWTVITQKKRMEREQAEAVTEVLQNVMEGAKQIDVGSQEIASSSQSLSEGASQQAANLEEISSSLEEMSSRTKQNTENAKQATNLSEESQKSADKGQQEMSMMTEAMVEIKKSSTEISKIVKVIDEIAFQTNLLALNAAVEAARAGEAGKGIAVVAEEFRYLAQRSAETAKNTATMIEESTQLADNGVAIAKRVGDTLEEIVGSTNKVNALLGKIASAAQEQSEGLGRANKGLAEMDKVTQSNAGNSQQLASAAQQTAAQVTSLRDAVAGFMKGNQYPTVIPRQSLFMPHHRHDNLLQRHSRTLRGRSPHQIQAK